MIYHDISSLLTLYTFTYGAPPCIWSSESSSFTGQYHTVHWCTLIVFCNVFSIVGQLGTLDTVPLCVINSLLPDFLGTEWSEQWGESTECQRHSSTLEPNNQMLQSQFHIPANDVEKPMPIGQLYWTFGSHVDRKTWFYMALHIGYVLVLLKSGASSRQYWYPMKHESFWVSFGIPIFANPTLWDWWRCRYTTINPG